MKSLATKKSVARGHRRMLIIVSVLGSAGPLRMVVNEDEVVGGVIESALKLYAREGRLPVLGSDPDNFLLYCANTGSDALSPWETIRGSSTTGEGRKFLMCRKPSKTQPPNMTEPHSITSTTRKGLAKTWKAWLHKSFSFKISSY